MAKRTQPPKTSEPNDLSKLTDEERETLLKTVRTGEAAAKRIDKAHWKMIDDWQLIGKALWQLRVAAMVISGANQPKGKAYSTAWHRLTSRGAHNLCKFDSKTRSDAIWLFKHYGDDCLQWYRNLKPNEKLTINHPTTFKRRYYELFERAEPVVDDEELLTLAEALAPEPQGELPLLDEDGPHQESNKTDTDNDTTSGEPQISFPVTTTSDKPPEQPRQITPEEAEAQRVANYVTYNGPRIIQGLRGAKDGVPSMLRYLFILGLDDEAKVEFCDWVASYLEADEGDGEEVLTAVGR